MERRSFFKSLLVGAGALAFAPTVFIQPEINYEVIKGIEYDIIRTQWGDIWLRKYPLLDGPDNGSFSLEWQVYDMKTLKPIK